MSARTMTWIDRAFDVFIVAVAIQSGVRDHDYLAGLLGGVVLSLLIVRFSRWGHDRWLSA